MSSLSTILALASILTLGQAAPAAVISDTPFINVRQIIKSLGSENIANIIKTIGSSSNSGGPDLVKVLHALADGFDTEGPKAPGPLASFNFVKLLKGAGSIFDRIAKSYLNRPASEQSEPLYGNPASMEDYDYSKSGEIIKIMMNIFSNFDKETEVGYDEIADLIRKNIVGFLFGDNPQPAADNETRIADLFQGLINFVYGTYPGDTNEQQKF